MYCLRAVSTLWVATSMAGACTGAWASAASNFSMAKMKSRCDSAATPSSISALSWSIKACSDGATFTSMDVFSVMPFPLPAQEREASRTNLRLSQSGACPAAFDAKDSGASPALRKLVHDAALQDQTGR